MLAAAVFVFRFPAITDDGPTCHLGTPVFAVAQGLLATVGALMLLAATRVGTDTASTSSRGRLRVFGVGGLLAAATWIAMVTVWLPQNPTHPGVC
jgi:hypothetical protein